MLLQLFFLDVLFFEGCERICNENKTLHTFGMKKAVAIWFSFNCLVVASQKCRALLFEQRDHLNLN